MNYTIYILLFFALLSVSTSPILGRWMSPDLHGVTIAFWRMSIATLILWTISVFKYINYKVAYSRRRFFSFRMSFQDVFNQNSLFSKALKQNFRFFIVSRLRA